MKKEGRCSSRLWKSRETKNWNGKAKLEINRWWREDKEQFPYPKLLKKEKRKKKIVRRIRFVTISLASRTDTRSRSMHSPATKSSSRVYAFIPL